MLSLLLSLLLLGVIAGFLARLLVPGRDPMGFWATVSLGVVGSFVGGFLGSLLFGGRLVLRTAGILGSIVGAVIVLLLYRRLGRSRRY